MSEEFDHEADEKIDEDVSELLCKQLDMWVAYVKRNYLITSLYWDRDDSDLDTIEITLMDKYK